MRANSAAPISPTVCGFAGTASTTKSQSDSKLSSEPEKELPVHTSDGIGNISLRPDDRHSRALRASSYCSSDRAQPTAAQYHRARTSAFRIWREERYVRIAA